MYKKIRSLNEICSKVVVSPVDRRVQSLPRKIVRFFRFPIANGIADQRFPGFSLYFSDKTRWNPMEKPADTTAVVEIEFNSPTNGALGTASASGKLRDDRFSTVKMHIGLQRRRWWKCIFDTIKFAFVVLAKRRAQN